MLIRDLTIKGYRCFEDFSIDGLTRVNLLVGNNNSGKTSFLEAIYLLVNQPSMGTGIKAIQEIFDNRSEFSNKFEKTNNQSQQIVNREYFLDHLFYGYGNNKSRNFRINCLQEIGMSLIGILELKYEDYIALLYPHDKSMLVPNKFVSSCISKSFLLKGFTKKHTSGAPHFGNLVNMI
jgi:AAA15 family ATPase/GTPase